LHYAIILSIGASLDWMIHDYATILSIGASLDWMMLYHVTCLHAENV